MLSKQCAAALKKVEKGQKGYLPIETASKTGWHGGLPFRNLETFQKVEAVYSQTRPFPMYDFGSYCIQAPIAIAPPRRVTPAAERTGRSRRSGPK